MRDIKAYEDIIDLPHPVSARYGSFTRAQRAAQFAPFAALSGHADELAEEAEENEWSRLHELETEVIEPC